MSHDRSSQPTNHKPQTCPSIHCAIYTRKSTEEGLEQAFNSLDAQRESAEAYIASMKHEGWVCLPDRYDDGGYTGGNMERPAVKRLMADIESGKVDCVVVYKVDRLSRSLMDFAKMMETFDKRHVSFVSVTQHFNTTNSMGRMKRWNQKKTAAYFGIHPNTIGAWLKEMDKNGNESSLFKPPVNKISDAVRWVVHEKRRTGILARLPLLFFFL